MRRKSRAHTGKEIRERKMTALADKFDEFIDKQNETIAGLVAQIEDVENARQEAECNRDTWKQEARKYSQLVAGLLEDVKANANQRDQALSVTREVTLERDLACCRIIKLEGEVNDALSQLGHDAPLRYT